MNSESRRVIGKHILQRKIVDFPDAQPTFAHETEHGCIARRMNVRKENLDLFFTRIARERLWLAEEVSPRDDWARHGNLVDDGEEVIERAERRKPAVDRERRESLRDAVVDVIVNIVKTYSRGRFLCPRKEEHQVAEIMLLGARGRVLAFQPIFEFVEFRVHGSLLLEGGYQYEEKNVN
jgi:hypothetical protein